MNKKILKITKIFLMDYYRKINIIQNKKLNLKSAITYFIFIIEIFLIYFSQKALDFFYNINQSILFLKVYLPIIAILILFQIIILISNIFYYSKDLEYILPLPIKPVEIAISKLNTVIIITYFFEMIFLLLPLTLYGLLIEKNLIYYIFMLITLLIFPILYILIFSIIILFVTKMLQKIRNKNIKQFITTFIVTILLICLGYVYIQNIIKQENIEANTKFEEIILKIDEINDKFIVINPSIDILVNSNVIYKIMVITKLICINVFFLLLFIYFMNKLYLNILLNNININIKLNSTKKTYKTKKNNLIYTYIKTDFKILIRNFNIALQNILQYIIITIIIAICIASTIGATKEVIIEQNLIEEIGIEKFKLQATLLIIAIVQIIFTFSNLSIISISKEGKNANFIKYIPIQLYSQLKIKILPQIIINTIVIIIILSTIFFKLKEISIIYFIGSFIILMLINIIDSYISVLIDVKKPILNWTNIEALTKNNERNICKYILTILMLGILKYLSEIFSKFKYNYAIICIILIFFVIYLILKKYIKKNINKIFKNIY